METTTIDALVLEEAQVIEVLEAARLQLELCEEPMRSGQLEPRQPHGSPERRPGTLVRAMGEFARSKGLFPSIESLAHKLREDLESHGITYHFRTLKRQISGFIDTVPPEVESALAKVVFNGNDQRSGVDIRQLCAEAGIGRPNGNDSPAYVLSGKVLPLAQLWLHLNPQASKRALAVRLQRDIEEQSISYTVGTLEAILAGKNRLFVSPAIGDRLLEYLRDAGINSRTEAEARIQAQAEAIRRSLDAREFVPIGRFHELCLLWLWKHREATARQLSTALRQKLSERGVGMKLDALQRAVSGRPRQVRCQLQEALEDVLLPDLPPSQDLDTALATTWRERERRRHDMDWVRVEPIAAMVKTWLERHPGMSKRQLAIRLSARIREMGYSMCHDTLQPILGGWKKKTRRFVYRAMLIDCPSVKCLTKSCVYPAIREGLCRVCLLRKYDPVRFEGMSPLGGKLW